MTKYIKPFKMRLKMPPKPIPYVRMVIIKDGRAKKGDKVIALEETTLQECYDYFNGLIQYHLKRRKRYNCAVMVEVVPL